MNLDQIPLLAMIKGKLGYLSDRQKLIAQNVANADTPGYRPQDLKPFTFEGQVQTAALAAAGGSGLSATQTNAGHIATPVRTTTTWKAVTAPDSEARLDGNQVVLEDQMVKMSEARLDYDAAIGLYQKSLAMLRLAARRPGG